MNAEEYFGDYINFINKKELYKIMKWLLSIKDSSLLCPSPKNVFKAFRFCPFNKCRVIMIGQDPYPQKGVAQGLLFGNSKNTSDDRLSPSLQVIKEAVINYEIPHGRIEFDNTLESWAEQGVLLLNSALTCEVGKVGSHFTIWKPFMEYFIEHISKSTSGIIYVLFGNQAKLFKPCIKGQQHIIEEYHPAYYSRANKKMPYSTFTKINNILYKINGERITFFKDIK